MLIHEKLKAMRNAEGLTQNDVCQLLDFSISTLKKYETGVIEPGASALMKYTRHPRFKKYAYWLTTDETMPEVGHISPPLSLDGSETPTDAQESIRTIQKSHR
ncbi:TPA: helix-turn-helix transcriptional regulator [Salmonella enterica]|uniref:Helix-turn-helix transcriptional regulator n=1 Tax=Salmonella enterica TaxID=28901 RepID=A0A743PGW3_SALER|nr:helix-turn-helix transcriptional regulator [Salmonella enterica]